MLRQETETVIEQYLTNRTPENRERLVLQSVPLVHYILGRLGITRDMGSEYEDLVHQGLLGLIDAVDRYDTSYGTRFSTFAGLRIRGKILDYMRYSDWMPRSARRRVRAIQKTISNLWLELNREPEEEEIARRLGVGIEEVQRGLSDSNRIFLSLDSAPGGESEGEEDGALYERLADDQQPDPSEQAERQDMVHLLGENIRALPEREQLILSLYYVEELTFREIGKVLEITESRVCQLHARAIINLKAMMNHE
jgi:RNA polymerase sigma factor for flagellar operon FliA